MGLQNTRDNRKYVTVLGDGTIRLSVTEETEGAVKREYETSDKKTGVKFELIFSELSGKITGLNFQDGDYGKNIQIEVTDGEPIVLSLNTASNFGEDFLKKLPNIDLTKDVILRPYSFEDDNGKLRKGITVLQAGGKIQSYFYDVEGKKNVNGYPTPDPKKVKSFDTDDWKVYFIEARKFLIAYAENNIPLIKETEARKVAQPKDKIEYPTEEKGDIPF